MLKFLDLLAVEIQFSMMFRFSLVNARVFGTSNFKFLKNISIAHISLLRACRGLLRSCLGFQFFILFNLKSLFFDNIFF